MDSTLGTTNLLLAVMAAVSVLQALVLIGAAVAVWKAYTQATMVLAEARQQIEPVIARVTQVTDRVDAIIADVSAVTARVASATAHAEAAVGTVAAFVGGPGAAASRFGRTVRWWGVVRGIRAAYRTFVDAGGDGRRGSKEGGRDAA